MARPQQAIQPFVDGRNYKVAFFHPLVRKVIRRSLGTSDPDVAKSYAGWLSRIRDDRSAWKVLPKDTPRVVRDIWMVSQELVKVPVTRTDGSRAEVSVPPLPGQFKKLICKHYKPGMDWHDIIDFSPDDKAEAIARYLDDVAQEMEVCRAQQKVAVDNAKALQDKVTLLEKELQIWRRKRLKALDVPTLEDGKTKFLAEYNSGSQSPSWKSIVGYTIKRFVKYVGPKRKADEIDEKEIDVWLNSLRDRRGKGIASAGRRKQARTAVLKFLESVGVNLDRNAVTPITRRQIQQERGEIVWLEKPEAERLIAELYKLPKGNFWGDVARVQVAHGWRPEEIPLIQSRLAEPEQMTVELIHDRDGALLRRLKNGRRTVRTPAALRDLIKARVRRGMHLLFPYTELSKRRRKTGPGLEAELWNPPYFDSLYLKQLRAAAGKAKIATPMDCRILRRTCASLLLRAGHTTDEVATVLGDDPETIRNHYARLLPHEVDTTAAAI